MNSKTSEAWAIVSKCVRRQLGGKVSDGDLTIIILAAAQHALEESAEHFSASQVCEVVQRLVSREESAKTPLVERNGRKYDSRITADDVHRHELYCDHEGELSTGKRCALCDKCSDMRERPKAGTLGTLCYVNDRVPCTVLDGSTRMRVLVDSASGRKVMTRRPNGEYAEQGLRSPMLALGWQESYRPREA